MPANPFDNLSKVFGIPKMSLQSVSPAFPYQTTPPKVQPPAMISPQAIGMNPGFGQRPLQGDPMQGLVGKDSDIMLQGLMQAMGQMQQAAPPPPGAPPPEDDMSGPTGGEPSPDMPDEVQAMQGEDQAQTQANLPQAGSLREPVPYIPSKRRGGR